MLPTKEREDAGRCSKLKTRDPSCRGNRSSVRWIGNWTACHISYDSKKGRRELSQNHTRRLTFPPPASASEHCQPIHLVIAILRTCPVSTHSFAVATPAENPLPNAPFVSISKHTNPRHWHVRITQSWQTPACPSISRSCCSSRPLAYSPRPLDSAL